MSKVTQEQLNVRLTDVYHHIDRSIDKLRSELHDMSTGLQYSQLSDKCAKLENENKELRSKLEQGGK
jgi:hypothetical protein